MRIQFSSAWGSLALLTLSLPLRAQVSYDLAANFGSGSTCTGVSSDAVAFSSFLSTALTWQTSNAGLITLNIPVQGTTSNISSATYGTGATATAALNGSSLTITVGVGGSGYNASTVSVTLTGGTGSGGAVGTIAVSGGAVQTIPFTGGSWSVAPTVTVNSALYVTTAAPHGWSTGQWVTLTAPGLNIFNTANYFTAQITVVDGSDFSFPNVTSGTYTSGGTASSSACVMTSVSNPFLGLLNVKVTATGVTLVGNSGGFQLGNLGTSTIGPNGGSGAVVTAALTGTAVSGCSVSMGGTNYYREAFAIVSGGGGNGATLALTVSAGQAVNGCSVTNGGMGYTSPVTVTVYPSAYSARVATVAVGASQVTLLTPWQCAIFAANGFPTYALMAGIDLQGNGYPINPGFFEYIQVTGCNNSTGAVTFAAPLSNAYESTWPAYNSGGKFQNDEGGPATLFWLDQSWNIALEIDGATISSAGQTYTDGRSVLLSGVTFSGGNCGIPSQNQSWTLANATMTGCDMEVDKMNGTVTLNNVNIRHVIAQSSSTNLFIFEGGSSAVQITGTFGNFQCLNSTIGTLSVGVPSFGAGNSAILNNCPVTTLGYTGQFMQQAFTQLGYTMSNGIIAFPNGSCCSSGGPMINIIPGETLTWAQSTLAGYPLRVIDLTQDAMNTYIETNGSTIPVMNGVSATKLISSPGYNFTCISCSGGTVSSALNGVSGQPIFSNSTYALTPITSQALLYGGIPVHGLLQSLSICVNTPYTGVRSTLTLSVTDEFSGGFPTLRYSDNSLQGYDPAVNLKIVGCRVITPAGVTGTQSGDSNLSIGSATYIYGTYYPWLSNTISGESSAVWPSVTITWQTNPLAGYPGGGFASSNVSKVNVGVH